MTLTAFRHGAFEDVLNLADAGLAIARQQRDVTELLRVKAAALALSNRAEEAHLVAEECVRRAERQGEPGLLAHALSVHQFVLGRLNRHEESLEVGQRAIDLALHRDVPKKAMPAVNAFAETLWLLGRAEEAYTVIEQMLHKSDHDYPLATPFMINQRARMYEQLQQYDRARQDYQAAGELFLSFENKSSASAAFANAADMLLNLGQEEQAQRLLLRANGYLHPSDVSARVYIKRVEGALYLLRNDLDRARETFEWVLRTAEQLNNDFEIVIARGYLSTIAKQQGTLDSSLVELFVRKLDTFGHDWVLRRYSSAWRDFYRECVENGWHTKRLQPYLNLRILNFSLPAKPKLELKFFGTFRAQLANTEVKLSSRPQEVLAYLVIHGSTRIDVLADAIWPDATSRSAKRNLAQQIRALRETLAQALGSSSNLLITEEGSYRLSDSIEVKSDTGALENATDSSPSDEVLQVVRSYEGELLPHIYSEWVLQARRHYEHTAASLALTLARQQKPASVQLAIELYEKTIHIDPFLEEAYNELIRAYEDLHDYSAVLRVQRRWKDLESNLKHS